MTSNRNYIASIITKFSGQSNVIPIPVIYLEITKDYPTAALLNQMVYWSDRTKRNDGYFYKSYKEWEEELHLSKYQVRRSTDKLKELNIVETALKKTNGAPTLHYKIDLNTLQDWIVKKLNNGKLRNLTMDSEETSKSLTEITTENTTESISMSDKSDAAPYKTIIEYLNKKVNKRFSYKSESNRKLIKARFNEGYKLDDFIKVIDIKTNEWINDEKMKGYLQPSTLFRGSNFDKYLNQDEKTKPSSRNTNEEEKLFDEVL
ncbi:conserved phage C-terminal domain-containing protein [Mammaliicoccus sciuri]|uniref:conserved phage C-terminal domain-containing protein n=1 Tax=Mammaliicoccus sciuri TaxID=1296 RepID=UPI00288819C5|nr:conserved phage C-terminal domain-containing protein [Mammaliicoccus sciuri]MDT0745461.1 conserved phage C-terminal domain-containing protein [Mammaliicoccus sciuri]